MWKADPDVSAIKCSNYLNIGDTLSLNVSGLGHNGIMPPKMVTSSTQISYVYISMI